MTDELFPDIDEVRYGLLTILPSLPQTTPPGNTHTRSVLLDIPSNLPPITLESTLDERRKLTFPDEGPPQVNRTMSA